MGIDNREVSKPGFGLFRKKKEEEEEKPPRSSAPPPSSKIIVGMGVVVATERVIFVR